MKGRDAMSKQENAPVEVNAEVVKDHEDAVSSLVDTLFDVGTAWAEYGIGYGKFALESSAKVLARTAKALEELQERLKKDDGADKAA
jgi:hypothetical protein